MTRYAQPPRARARPSHSISPTPHHPAARSRPNAVIAHSPDTLLADVELYLHQNCPRVHVLWGAPVCPELNAIELVWGQGKLYAAVAYTGKRTTKQLRNDLHDGLYTIKVARPGETNVHGGNFVKDATGRCLSAEALFQHVLYSPKGGVAMAIAHDKDLSSIPNQVIGQLKLGSLSTIVREEPLELTSLAQIKWATAQRVRDTAAAGDDVDAEIDNALGNEQDEPE